MADILDSAQKVIDDAAQSAGTPASPASPPPEPPKENIPSSPPTPGPGPIPMVALPADVPMDLPLPKDEHLIIPQKEKHDEERFVVPPPTHPGKKSSGSKGALLAVLALLVLLVPIAFFINQRTNVTQLPGRAAVPCLACVSGASGNICRASSDANCLPSLNQCGPAGVPCSVPTLVPNGGPCTEGYQCSSGSCIRQICSAPLSSLTPTPTGATCAVGPTYCVGNNPYGVCVDIGGYWCAKLKANTGFISNASCTCPSGYTWKHFEYGSWWCFNTASECSPGGTIPQPGGGTLNTEYTCQTTPGTIPPSNYCTMPGSATNTPGPTITNRPTLPPGPTNTSVPQATNTSVPQSTNTRSPTPTRTRTPTPTSTIPPGGQCDRIVIYNTSGTNITQALLNGTSGVKPGDTIVLAVAGTNATRAHFRVNGAPATYTETTQTNSSGEYILSIILPTIGNQFTVEAEVLVNGIWK